MTWISLVCLFVLTSSAFGQSGYGGGYGSPAPVQQVPKLISLMRDQTIQRPFVPPVQIPTQNYGQNYGQQVPTMSQRILPVVQQQDTSFMQQKLPGGYGQTLTIPTLSQRVLPTQNYGQGYGVMPVMQQFDQPQQQVLVPTQADILCQGQQPETVIPIENARKFIVCLDSGKGVEQECPRGLVYHQGSKRCERKLGPLEDPCALQPCLNGGQCVHTESWYQCQCAPGFDGVTCELDARVCQTQQPCGQSPDSKCQSFRLGAALSYICILQGGLAYGLSPQQAVPSPCQGVDGPQALTVTKDGFILCDGESMFVESCPGGTIWDDVEKACTWPDMQTSPQLDQQQNYGQSYVPQQKWIPQSTYSSQIIFPQPKMIPQSTYSSQIVVPQQPKSIQSYNTQMTIPKEISYSVQMPIPQQFEQPKHVPYHHVQMNIPKDVSSYGVPLTIPQQFDLPKQVPSYGSQIPVTQQFDLPKQVSSYGSQIPVTQQFDLPKQVPSYNTQFLLPTPPQQRKFSQPIIPQHDDIVSNQQSSPY